MLRDIAGRRRREQILFALLVILAAILVGTVALRALREAGGSNSYALVARSFLTGVPFVDRCFDGDCAVRDGRFYVIFPPFPGIVALPLVALFGEMTRGFVAVAMIATALGLVLWERIFRIFEVPLAARAWLVFALALASPLYYVTLRAEGVWFFAQAIAFPLVAAAIHEALRGRLLIAGAALAAAMLSRQLSVFYAPILFALAVRSEPSLFTIDRRRIGLALKLALPLAIGVLCHFGYNLWRFGTPFDSGYASIAFQPGMLRERVDAHGIWSSAYLVFNALYLFFQGFHATFNEPERLVVVGLDNAGTAILVASPWLAVMFYTPRDRMVLLCGAMIVAFAGALLFYHSNGFSQYNTQRYTLDWIPAALILIAGAMREQARLESIRLAVVWGAALNVVTVLLLALTRAGPALRVGM